MIKPKRTLNIRRNKHQNHNIGKRRQVMLEQCIRPPIFRLTTNYLHSRPIPNQKTGNKCLSHGSTIFDFFVMWLSLPWCVVYGGNLRSNIWEISNISRNWSIRYNKRTTRSIAFIFHHILLRITLFQQKVPIKRSFMPYLPPGNSTSHRNAFVSGTPVAFVGVIGSIIGLLLIVIILYAHLSKFCG